MDTPHALRIDDDDDDMGQSKEEVIEEEHKKEIDRLKRRIKSMKVTGDGVELGPVSQSAVNCEISGDTNGHDNNSDQEDDFETYCSPHEFAVGPKPRTSTCGPCQKACCSCFNRVGNMTIIRESIDRDGKRQLDCVLGPCWPFLFW